MEIKELRDGSEDEDWEWLEAWEEEDEWEEVEAWEEVGSGYAVLPGGGAAAGDATPHGAGGEATRHGTGGDATRHGAGGGATRQDSGELTGRGGGEGTRRGDGEGTRHGSGDLTGHGDGHATRRGSGDLTGRVGGDVTRRVGGEGTRHGDGDATGQGAGGWFDYAKRTVIAAGARVLFYPTLATNVARNKMQYEFHWWDRVDEHVLLGAVPFRRHVPRLMKLGVTGVVTLTESFETLVPKSEYEIHGIENLAIPTCDYYAAPSIENISSAISFMRRIASRGQTTYVHCKAGRGRSTTVVLCYLIKYKNMSPQEAWNHTRSIRPRVSLTRAQHEAVIQFDKELHSSDPLREVFVADPDLIGYEGADGDSSMEDIARHQSDTSKMPDP